ncbi:hypothetical protein V6N12_009548 [Hibiscus sabdariffa]|uniref:Uncharacterized protein n=1 Tax=Hibiscus sabdariffa TaxID=183260 RepID=A0ABR2AUD2_9ROSI
MSSFGCIGFAPIFNILFIVTFFVFSIGRDVSNVAPRSLISWLLLLSQSLSLIDLRFALVSLPSSPSSSSDDSAKLLKLCVMDCSACPDSMIAS